MIEEGIAGDNNPDDDPPTPFNSEEIKKRVAQINRENKSKEEQKAIKTLENKLLPKLEEYERHLDTLGNRNSYSKTDTDETFMRMKEDHILNGQLKPAYNVQISTESQFISHYDFYPYPTDTLTLIPFLNSFENRYNNLPGKVVADSGYGSEENYEFMQDNDIEPFVKFNYYHKEQKRAFKKNGFLSQNLYYNSEEDYYVCPMVQHMDKVGNKRNKTASGYTSTSTLYEAKNCNGCPLKCLCTNAKGNRRIEVSHNLNRHKQRIRELLTSEEGVYHRSQRPIEPESVFGQTKSNKHYNRFRHFKKDKFLMDFAIFAIAFNIGKLHLKGLNNKEIWAFLGKYGQKGVVILFLVKIGVNFKSFSSVNNYNQKTAA
ncbi:MAG: transposase [Fermentimonas sp.]|nr:transposase [Fermentimonas sp.]